MIRCQAMNQIVSPFKTCELLFFSDFYLGLSLRKTLAKTAAGRGRPNQTEGLLPFAWFSSGSKDNHHMCICIPPAFFFYRTGIICKILYGLTSSAMLAFPIMLIFNFFHYLISDGRLHAAGIWIRKKWEILFLAGGFVSTDISQLFWVPKCQLPGR